MTTMELDQLMSQPPKWRMRTNRPKIPIERWGRDHWSLFDYVHTVITQDGLIDWRKVGVSSSGWPMLWNARDHGAAPGRYTSGGDFAELYGLRLKWIDGENFTLKGVCEVDALMDMSDAGLITLTMPKSDKDGDYFLKPNGAPLIGEEYPSPRFVTGLGEWTLMPWAKFGLTDRGWRVAQAWSKHKDTSDSIYSDFEAPE